MSEEGLTEEEFQKIKAEIDKEASTMNAANLGACFAKVGSSMRCFDNTTKAGCKQLKGSWQGKGTKCSR